MQIRRISVFLRQRRSVQEGARILASFHEWRRLQQLPEPRPAGKKLLLIRLDDIGDYLLFRNQLPMYKQASRWKDYSITLLGNTSWKEIFTTFDASAVDDSIWVNKSEYLTSAPYRLQVWQTLRARGFETVVAASCTRPLLLDDLCMLAAAPRLSIGSSNNYVHAAWNRVSDRLYQELFRAAEPWIHEFHFNGLFTQWVCGIRYPGSRPTLEAAAPPRRDPYIICFIGANTRSKCWPSRRWLELIKLWGEAHSGAVVLAGASRGELQMAADIQKRARADSIAGKVSLPELIQWVAGAQAVITNDTMAAHLGASLDRSTVIIANGVNYQRFTDYERAGIGNVATVYPLVFSRKRKRVGEFNHTYAEAVSADIASIKARSVLDALERLLQAATPRS
jgi:ADP-heptose:LPS heptosyltransferase